MIDLLKHYSVDVEFPNVSGLEHLEMLYIRDKLAELEPTLTAAERNVLAAADQRLVAQADKFYAELSQVVNLAERRQAEQIAPQRWWWYLDVLIYLPRLSFPSERSRRAVVRVQGCSVLS